MGVWGFSLYENDIGSDVRAYFEAQLRNGKSGSTITQELVEQYQDALADPEDAPAFWLALADTQWDLGRLEKGVKDKALLYLEYGGRLFEWAQPPKQFGKSRNGSPLCIKGKTAVTPAQAEAHPPAVFVYLSVEKRGCLRIPIAGTSGDSAPPERQVPVFCQGRVGQMASRAHRTKCIFLPSGDGSIAAAR